jgi:hypothetical protein
VRHKSPGHEAVSLSLKKNPGTMELNLMN